MNTADALRELEKILHAVSFAAEHHTKDSESKAAQHLSDRVLYSPLATALIDAQRAANRIRDHLGETDEPAGAVDVRLAAILRDLDRCPHGRHEGDTCAGWTGPGDYDGGCRGGYSLGNPHMQTGTVIGYDVYARTYRMPDREHRHDSAAWLDATGDDA